MGKGTIFYVHGAGNRDKEAADYEAALRLGLFGAQADPALAARLQRSTWGQQAGPDAAFPLLDATLPEVVSGDVGFVTAPDLADPVAPLKALAPEPGKAALAAGSVDADLLLMILEAGLVDLSDEGISADALRQAAKTVASSSAYRDAAGPGEALIDATLESVATVVIANEGAGALGPGDLVKAVGAVAGAIGKALLGSGVASVVGSWLGTNLGPPAKLALSKRLARERGQFMRKSILVPADVLFYQRNGEEIRSWVRMEIGKLEPPVVALGHSLGGIILVDALFTPDSPKTNVELLITFGSQSAFLQSIGALGPLTPNLPWLNLWTRYDFASFLAGSMWPGLVRDVEIPIDVGFPDAHGAYYESAQFFTEIKAHPIVKEVLV